jgi:phospho-N-acetylmuramoyl-pentapeptide-transferase
MGPNILVIGGATFVTSLIIGAVIIPYLRRLRVGQPIRLEGPRTHMKKAGTPTMGGLIFLIGPTAVLFCMQGALSRNSLLVLGLTLSYALIGFLDDYRKVKRLRSLGLRAREKLFLEILFAAIFMWIVTSKSSYVIVPFTGTPIELGWFYPILGIFLIVGLGNAVNFADGLDGLAGGLVTISLAAYYYIVVSAPASLALYEMAPLIAAFIAGILAFLVYNRHPARVIMGDVGSLALGALLAGIGVTSHTELVLPFLAAVPGVEVVSVILQVASFQLFGKRIFKMSPLHHHFELSGWSETRVVYVFWAAQAVLAVLGVVSMMLVR